MIRDLVKVKNNPKDLVRIRMSKFMSNLRFHRLCFEGICKSAVAHSAIPPTPLQPFRVFPEIAGMFIPSEADKKAYEKLKGIIEKSEPLRYPSTIPRDKVYWRSYVDGERRRPKPKMVEYCEKPPRILYEEDLIRYKFYGSHPSELDRPVDLTEDPDSSETAIWKTLNMSADGSQIDCEYVVKKTLQLEKKKNYSRAQAYRTALKKFYNIRVREEIHTRSLKEMAEKISLCICEDFKKINCGIGSKSNKQRAVDDMEENYVSSIREASIRRDG